jgi:hypothetical protein
LAQQLPRAFLGRRVEGRRGRVLDGLQKGGRVGGDGGKARQQRQEKAQPQMAGA